MKSERPGPSSRSRQLRRSWVVLTCLILFLAVILAITTAGYDRNSICWELHDYALKVRDGILDDPTFLPVIYAADPEDDWEDPKIWRKANPGLGVSIKMDYLKEECRRAKESPAYQNTFRRLHLNQWTEQAVRWMEMAAWDACDGFVDEEELRGKMVVGGKACGSAEVRT